MASDNPMDQIARVRELFREAAEAVGLELKEMFFIPAPAGPGTPHYAQAVLIVDPEKCFTSPEEKQMKDEFEAIIQGDKMIERQQREDAARRGLVENLRDLSKGDGIGLDDE